MRKSILRLVVANLISRLTEDLPISGHPFLRDLEARSLVIIDAMPNGHNAEVGNGSGDLGESIPAAIEWLCVSLLRAHAGDSWAGLAIHSIRIYALGDTGRILSGIVPPVKSIDSAKPCP